MKLTRRIMCLTVALLICVMMTNSVYAAVSGGKIAGVYVNLQGNAGMSGYYYATTTSVKVNPDQAYLKTTADYATGTFHIGIYSSTSARGAVTLAYNFLVPANASYVYTCHEVYGGTESEGFALYLEESLSDS